MDKVICADYHCRYCGQWVSDNRHLHITPDGTIILKCKSCEDNPIRATAFRYLRFIKWKLRG